MGIFGLVELSLAVYFKDDSYLEEYLLELCVYIFQWGVIRPLYFGKYVCI